MPMEAYDGINGKPTTPMPIKAKEASMAGFLPMRSPRRPSTIAPSGRVKNPAPNVASDASKLAPGVSEGKNVRPI